MTARRPIPKKRERPRRKRPYLFPPKHDKMAEQRKQSLKMRLRWWDGSGWSGALRCALCHHVIEFFSHLEADHIKPGKMGGCKDNSDSNYQPAHWWCNREKGSRRNYARPA